MSATSPLPAMVCRGARCESNQRLASGSHVLALRLPGPLPPAGPGQFAMLSLERPDFPLLPRPFSLLGWEGDASSARVEFLIMPVGRGSGALCDLQPGQPVQLVGPLGQRFEQGLPTTGPLVCVAGGYGVAPFLFLCERLARHDPERLAHTTVIYGARTAERLGLRERLAASGARVELATDDGSAGFHGRVDALLAERLAAEGAALVLTCGPDPMMEAVGAVCAAAGVPARASLETVMGCGYAVCNGCAVGVGDERDPEGHAYELACREGTLFDTDRLRWELL